MIRFFRHDDRTPGPWHVQSSEGSKKGLWVETFEGAGIAYLPPWMWDVGSRPEGNAQLIAAAPDLYSAVVRANHVLASILGQLNGPASALDTTTLKNEANEALAKLGDALDLAEMQNVLP
jgi:hypothetical protein